MIERTRANRESKPDDVATGIALMFLYALLWSILAGLIFGCFVFFSWFQP